MSKPGLFRQSQAIKNRFPSRATGTPRLDEHMLIVFCMLLVSSVQVKHQGSDQISIPAMSSFKVHVKVHAFQVQVHVFSIQSIQEKHQGSDLPAMIIAIQVKCQGSDRPAMVIQVKHQGPYRPPMSPAIQVKHQDSDLPLYGYSVESTKIMLHGSRFSLWL
ncbi:hypothetical protein F4703DRAFT_1947516 [Phycomyces blakesleeanus]